MLRLFAERHFNIVHVIFSLPFTNVAFDHGFYITGIIGGLLLWLFAEHLSDNLDARDRRGR